MLQGLKNLLGSQAPTRRCVLVTGGNKGIGLAVVTRLLTETDLFVYLGSRDQGRGEVAVKTVVDDFVSRGKKEEDVRQRLDVLLIDPMSKTSVEEAAEKVKGRGDQFAGIVNNAGGFLPFNEMLDLHLYGPKRVVDTFLPLMVKNDAQYKNGIVVNVSSGGSAVCVARSREDRRATLSRTDLSWEDIDNFATEIKTLASNSCGTNDDQQAELEEKTGVEWSLGGYGFTKAILNSYTCWLQTQYPSLRAFAINPGFIETDLTRPFLGDGEDKSGAKSTDHGAAAICSPLIFTVPSTPEPQQGKYLDHDTWRRLDEINPKDFSA